MIRRILRVWLLACVVLTIFGSAPGKLAAAQTPVLSQGPDGGRPFYKIDAAIDYDLLTFTCRAEVTVPATARDPLHDASFFIYANAGGVGGTDERRKNIAVDGVTYDGAAVPFVLDGPVLHVQMPRPETTPFTLIFSYHGVVPRGPSGSGLMDMMGGVSGDLGGLLGGLTGGSAGAPPAAKPKNTDYGLYTYRDGILSLGAFWYPALAVRRAGHWVDEAPEGLGDVAYSEMCDFEVRLQVPDRVVVAEPGATQTAPSSRSGMKIVSAQARDVRDFCVLMSEDYVTSSRNFRVGDRQVVVVGYTLRRDQPSAARAVDIAGSALQIYDQRFGQYPYDRFNVVEGTISGGAGGMEFSAQTSIAAGLYGDLSKQFAGLAGELTGGAGLDSLMNAIDGEGAAAPNPPAAQPQGAARPAAPPVAATQDNPAASMLQSLLGEQKSIFDSLFEETIAHEVGHQWWAIGVGSDSVRDPFEDESLTNYSSMVYWEDRYGRDTMEKMMDLHLKQAYTMGCMLGGGDAPTNLRTSAYKNSMQYGAVVYGKGALYYDALRRAVGDPVFFASLREYYARYRDGLAGPRALRDIVQARAPKVDVNGLYKRWIEEAHGDEDIAGGHATSIDELLGGLLGGNVAGEQ